MSSPESIQTMKNTVTLNSGQIMPLAGLGTYSLRGEAGMRVIASALELGCRLLDTARMYGNEREVGEAVRASSVPREEIFVTTKLDSACASYERARAAVASSLERLGLDYADLVLVHEPYAGADEMYRALEDAQAEGLVKAIGVSNFGIGRYLALLGKARVVPAVNQMENHVYFQQEELRKVLEEHGTHMQAWSPLAEALRDIATSPKLSAIGRKYGRTAAQVAMRFLVQRGISVIPKTSKAERVKENMALFDFELDDAEMGAIRAMDTGKSCFSWSWV